MDSSHRKLKIIEIRSFRVEDASLSVAISIVIMT